MKSVSIFASHHVPGTAMGVRFDRARFLAELERHERTVTAQLVSIYALACLAGVLAIVLILNGELTAGASALGTAGLVGLLELIRRLSRDWTMTTLPLRAAHHASDEQLNAFVGSLLSAASKPPSS